jgi:ABC-type uncharacterized transport system substrate-binding protein
MLSGSFEPLAGRRVRPDRAGPGPNKVRCTQRTARLHLLVWTAGLLLQSAGVLRAQPCDVALVLTPSELYEQASSPIRDLLSRDGRRCEVVRFSPTRVETPTKEPATGESPGSRPAAPDGKSETELAAARLVELRPKVVVAVGTAATSLALKALPEAPVVFCMVPNFSDRQFTEGEGELDRLAGVTTDIAPADQVRWIKRLCPSLKTLGILYGERTRKTTEALAKAAQTQDVTVLRISAKLDQFPAAITELDNKGCEGVLMVADSEVYNQASVQRLLLWGVRNRKPVWTFSPNLVKAGAFAAIYSEPEPMARQVVQMVKKLLEGKKPKELGMQYADQALKAANERTAELIGVPLAKDVLDALDARFGQKK